jgi:hypothetical protein
LWKEEKRIEQNAVPEESLQILPFQIGVDDCPPLNVENPDCSTVTIPIRTHELPLAILGRIPAHRRTMCIYKAAMLVANGLLIVLDPRSH